MLSLLFNPWIIILIVLAVIFTIFVIYWVIKAHQKRVAAGKEDMAGRTALVESALTPKGMVLVEGELWTAILDKGDAQPGEEVTVTKVEGLKLRVTKKEQGGN